ncbi:MAG: adenosine deaminase, partial [Exiguobacterium sp.]|nr:adenosine deaminase [Exiguobacterium sp.]
MSDNSNLVNAKTAKADEYYTLRRYLDEEIPHYALNFHGKTVFCNCDDPRESAFSQYFIDHFDNLGLNRLIVAGYKDQQKDLFATDPFEKAFWFDYHGDDSVTRTDNPRVYFFRENGDFRSEESQQLLDESDIVVTNPPFSLFRDYMHQLLQSGQKFLVIGNVNAITYQEIFYAIKDHRLIVHPGEAKGHMDFRIPDDYPDKSTEISFDDEGNKLINLCFVRWFTNLERDKMPSPLPLTKRYSPEEYPRYDNYDAINVDETLDIPADYPGVMGVPVSFLDKYNPDQFEIVGMAKTPFNHRKIKT